MHSTLIALVAAAGFGVLVATQVPSADPSTDGSAPYAAWPHPPGAEKRVVTDPIPRPPAREPAPSADQFAAERGRVLRAAYDSVSEAVAAGCGLTPSVLAAVGQVESGSAGGRSIGAGHRVNPPIFGPLLDGGPRAAVPDTDGGSFDGSATWDRSMGLMQMLPATWRTLGVDGDADGLADPQNVYDSALAVGSHLCAGGRYLASEPALRDAVYAYRSSAGYVDAVLAWVRYFNLHGLDSLGDLGSARPPEVRTPELDSPTVVAAMPGRPTVTPGTSSTQGTLGLLANGLSTEYPLNTVVATPRTTSSSTVGPTPGANPATTTPGSSTVVPTSPFTTTPPATTPPGPTTTTDPPVTTTDPPVTTTDPPVTTTDPPVTTTDPPATTTDPPATTTDPPATTTTDPPATTTDSTTTAATTTAATTTAATTTGPTTTDPTTTP